MTKPLVPQVNLWTEKNGHVALSKWRVQLLKAIDETGSIRAAAASTSVAYSLAWRRLHEMETVLGVQLVERCKGGAHGGKASLTPAGQAYVARFEKWTQDVDAEIARRFREEFGDESPDG